VNGELILADSTRTGIAELECLAEGLLQITNPATRTFALEQLKTIKRTKLAIELELLSIKAQYRDIYLSYAKWQDFETHIRDCNKRLLACEKTIKQAIMNYDAEEERKRRAEEVKLRAEAEEKARKEREALLKKADKIKSPEKAEALRQQAEEVVAPTIYVESTTEKVEGESTRQLWRATLTDMKALRESPYADQFIIYQFDQTAANAFAKKNGNNVPVPGVEFKQIPSLAVRG
jgi:hypothetical protein